MTKEKPVWLKSVDTILRVIAAVPVSYAVASLWAIALSRLVPIERAQATLVGMLASFAICCAGVMWSFAASSGWRALWSLGLIGGAAGLIAWLSLGLEAA
ncbi:hypothetical protein D6851_14155 [Altericroceibacterium spongiae]|uniref:DUF3649 domain-containing protein n=1 Tax=Altericroceibacterium spongiae TaxID=2320269 RepID=A0A420EE54_9SPHN|nr:hypothetical protein [Altericroceibacterium spongiae]RKF18936.1 hypothetical protein D6851_14155 [Altericroceibacterium spongiae]